MKADDIILFSLNTLYLYLLYLVPTITHDSGLIKFLGKIRSTTLVFNVEEEKYFTGGGMGVTNVVQHKMNISESKPTSNTSDNKFKIFSIEEVEF